MYVLTFTADGRPRSKGSHIAQRVAGQRRLRAAAVQEDDLAKWVERIRTAGSLAIVSAVRSEDEDAPIRNWAGPVIVLARFRLVRPLRLADTLAYEPATVVPDGDKLERALWDALTGLAFSDDRQVVGWLGLKVYAGPLERAGVDVVVGALDEYDIKAGPGHVPALLGQLSGRWA